MNHNDKYEQIEAYLSGDLPEKEVAAFESKIAADPSLKREVDKHKLSHQSLEILIEDSLREELKKLRLEESQSESKGRVVSMRRMRVMWAAAAVIVALIGFVTFQWAGQTYSNNGLMASNYETVQADDIRFSGSQNVLNAAFVAFEQGEYNNVATMLDTVSSQNDYFGEAQYILGHTYLQQENYTEAQQAFQNTIDTEHPRLMQKAEWNVVLTYLKMEDMGAEFEGLLEQIASDSGHSYNSAAQELKKDLDSFWRGLAD